MKPEIQRERDIDKVREKDNKVRGRERPTQKLEKAMCTMNVERQDKSYKQTKMINV